MKYFLLTIVILLVNNAYANAQTNIEYDNKTILKTLNKYNIPSYDMLRELVIPESTLGNYPLKGKYFMTNTQDNSVKYIFVGRVNSCRTGGCSLSNNSTTDSNYEFFDYLVLFDKLKSILQVKIYNYQASHGHEITAKGWLKQFVGKDVNQSLEVNKNIDAISGATISVYAITIGIENNLRILKDLP